MNELPKPVCGTGDRQLPEGHRTRGRPGPMGVLVSDSFMRLCQLTSFYHFILQYVYNNKVDINGKNIIVDKLCWTNLNTAWIMT